MRRSSRITCWRCILRIASPGRSSVLSRVHYAVENVAAAPEDNVDFILGDVGDLWERDLGHRVSLCLVKWG